MIKTIDLKKGFTVLEFLVVIAIIGILVAVALTGIDLSRQRARDNTRISDLQNIILSLQQYHDVCREYPEDIYDTSPFASNGCPSGVTWESFVGAILEDGSMPVDPTSDTPYFYVGLATFGTNPRCIGYHIGTELEQEDNKVLDKDDDGNSTSPPWCGTLTGFDGEPSPDIIYDVIVNNN